MFPSSPSTIIEFAIPKPIAKCIFPPGVSKDNTCCSNSFECSIRSSTSEVTGISIMKMTKGLDEGPIYKKFKIDIKESDKEELEDKLSVIAAKNITSVLSEIKNKDIKPIAQNEDDASYCKKIKKESGLIDLQKDDSEKILLKFRAYKGWPGVFLDIKM